MTSGNDRAHVSVPVCTGVPDVDRFLAGLTDMAELDTGELTNGELHRSLMALADAASVLAGLTARLVDAWNVREVWIEDGSRSPSARLARDLHCSRRTANRLVKLAHDLRTMPATAEAFELAAINADHVELLREAAAGRRRTLFDRDEAILVEWCRLLGYFEARQAIAYWIIRADAELDSDGPCPRYDGRRASWSPGIGGEIDVRAVLDPIGGAEFVAAWDALEHEQYLADEQPGADKRTTLQRRADALVETARRATANPNAADTRVLVTVVAGEHSLSRLCELSNGAIIAPGELVPHISRIDVHTIVFDGPFDPIAASKQRSFTGALRRAIEVRDRHCQHPDGDRDPIADCDVDHIIPYSEGGCTCIDNGRLLSRHRNRNLRARDLTAADITVYDDDPLAIAARNRVAALIQSNAPPDDQAA